MAEIKGGKPMLGAICGDIIGSAYEFNSTRNHDFPLFTDDSTFTDDTVLTLAVCETLCKVRSKEWPPDEVMARQYALGYKAYYERYPKAGYGEMFRDWASRPGLTLQDSYGNGGAMRAVPIAYAFDDLDQVLRQAALSCWYTHRHSEAIAAAQAVAAAAYLARHGEKKQGIQAYIEKKFAYNLSVPLEKLRPEFVFDCRSGYSVPPAIIAFLESEGYEDAVRRAVSLGGDSDTMACIAGGIAEAYYGGVPGCIANVCWGRLDKTLRDTAAAFFGAFPVPGRE